ncbi:alpha/beta hydrolase [Streptococcus sp.]|nr:alpha/beta hydrolase [Streptococcus sp.]MDY3823806.1 alpha/beta hydrolase [Streptococcus sp.]
MNKKDILEQALTLRRLFKEGDDLRDKGLPTRLTDIERFDNISYGPDPKWHLLDIYKPKKALQYPVPTIINIHGGGWVYGTKETYQFYCMNLAQKGFAVINFNYRLAPGIVFPQELDDVNRAIHWVANHANHYELDSNNMFIIGDSAGGQMAMQYLAILTNSNFRKLFHYQLPQLTIRAAAINCGAAFITIPGSIEGGPQAYFTDEVLAHQQDRLQTERYLTTDLPPLFLMTSNQDFIRDCTIRLHGYCLAKGIQAEFHSYGTADHPKSHVFHCDIRDPIAQQCNQDEIDFFKQYVSPSL